MTRLLTIAPLAMAALLAGSRTLAAQTVVPVEQEPVHRVRFENDLVRVIDAAIPVGHQTMYHTHARDNVPVAVAAGRVATMLFGAPPVESAVAAGQVSFAAGGYTHIVRNAGTTPLHFIDVELRTSAPDPPPQEKEPGPVPGHTLVLYNSRVLVYRRTLALRAHGAAHRHVGAVLEVDVRGDAVQRAGGAIDRVIAGGFRWHGDGLLDAVANTGGIPYEIVEIEWVK